MAVSFPHLLVALLIAFYALSKFGPNAPDRALTAFLIFAPFYASGPIFITSVTFHLKFAEIVAMLLVVAFVLGRSKVDPRSIRFALLCLLPFLLSLVAGTIHFEPITVWEIERSVRTGFNKFGMRTSLKFNNITQLSFVILGLFVMVICASVRTNRDKILNAACVSLMVVNSIGILQLIMYYSGLYENFIDIFYNYITLSGDVTQTTSIQLFFGIKRISSVSLEPSLYAHFAAMTLFFVYFVGEGVNSRLKRISMIMTIICMIISTSQTAVAALPAFLILIAFYRRKYRVVALFFFILLIACVILALVYGDLIGRATEVMANFRGGSFRERFTYGFIHPLEIIAQVPFFGAAFGTDRALTLLFNVIEGIGLIGTAILIFAFRQLQWHRNFTIYSIFVFYLGFMAPDVSFVYIWAFLGLMQNRWVFPRQTEAVQRPATPLSVLATPAEAQ